MPWCGELLDACGQLLLTTCMIYICAMLHRFKCFSFDSTPMMISVLIGFFIISLLLKGLRIVSSVQSVCIVTSIQFGKVKEMQNATGKDQKKGGSTACSLFYFYYGNNICFYWKYILKVVLCMQFLSHSNTKF